MTELEKYRKNIEKAREAYNNGNLKESITLFEEATEDVADENDLLDLGLLHMENGNFPRAYDLISSVIEDFPNHPRGYYCLGYIYEEKEEFKNSLINYKKAYELEKRSSKYCFSLARIYDELGLDKEAEEYYQKTIQLSKNDYWANLNLGSLYERNNVLDKALNYTLEAYKIDSKKEMVNYNLGVIYARLEKYDLAMKHYLDEIKLENGYNLAYFNIGILYKDIYKDYENSKYYYLKGIQNNQESLSLWYNLGCVYALEENFDDAYQCMLYVALKYKDIFETIEKDNELEKFRKSEYYQKLKDEIR